MQFTDHDNHVFVTEMSGRLVDAMVKKRALRGFDMLIVMQCGHGRRSMVGSGRKNIELIWFLYHETGGNCTKFKFNEKFLP